LYFGVSLAVLALVPHFALAVALPNQSASHIGKEFFIVATNLVNSGHNPGLGHGCCRNAAEILIDVDNPATSFSDHNTYVHAGEDTCCEMNEQEFFFCANIIYRYSGID
jgi:hypothetical protein